MTTRDARIDAIRNAEGLAREGLGHLDKAIAIVAEVALAEADPRPGDMEAALKLLADARVSLRQIRAELDMIEDAGDTPRAAEQGAPS
jgi:hypothetical protein